jgi:predicted esterase
MSTNLSIPSLGVRVDTVTVTGFSSGGFMTNYMMLTDPQLFAGAGALNAGPPPLNTEEPATQWGSEPEELDIDQYMSWFQEKEDKNEIGDLRFLEGKPVYIFMGENDNIIPNQWTKTMRDLYKNFDANVKFESKPNYGHLAPLDPGRYLNKHLYENIPGSGFDA